MKRFRVPAVLLAGFAVAAVAAATALAAHTASFTATFSGTATEKVAGQSVTAAATGTGSGNLTGKSTISGTVTTSTANPPCGPLSGPGTIKSAKGILKVNVLPSSKGCAAGQDDQDNISLSGTIKVLGGTAKFKKAKGSIHFSGHYDRKSGAFTVKLVGPLTF